MESVGGRPENCCTGVKKFYILRKFGGHHGTKGISLRAEILMEVAIPRIKVELDSKKVKAVLVNQCSSRLERVPRQHRNRRVALRPSTEVLANLHGVGLVYWRHKEPLVSERATVISDFRRFSVLPLRPRQAALDGRNCFATNWSVRELVERLDQVGIRAAVIIPARIE